MNFVDHIHQYYPQVFRRWKYLRSLIGSTGSIEQLAGVTDFLDQQGIFVIVTLGFHQKWVWHIDDGDQVKVHSGVTYDNRKDATAEGAMTALSILNEQWKEVEQNDFYC